MYQYGDYIRVTSLYRESLTLRVEMGDKRGTAGCLEEITGTFGAQSNPSRAATLFGAAETLRETIGAPLHLGICLQSLFTIPQRPQSSRMDYEQVVANVRAQLTEEAFAAAFEEGRAMTMEQAVAYALSENA